MASQARLVDEAANVRDAALDGGDAEVTAVEGVELDRAVDPAGRDAAIVPLESEVAMRVIADETALQLLVEPPPPPPRPHDHPCPDLARVGHHAVRRNGCRRAAFERLRAGGPCVAQQQIVEKEAGDTTRGMRKLELVGAMASDDAASIDLWRVTEVDSEFFEEWQGVVGEKFAAQLVARKTVAVDQCDRCTPPCEQSRQR